MTAVPWLILTVRSTGRVEWLGEEASAGCIERSFLTRRLPGPVPGVLWSPQATAPQGTALFFHGGSGSKRSERRLRMGRRLASAGLAAIAIDGPYHGDRVPAPMTPPAYQQLIVAESIEAVTARMTADWLDAVSLLAGLGSPTPRTSASSGCRWAPVSAPCLPRPHSGRACSAPSWAISASARPRHSTPGSGPPA